MGGGTLQHGCLTGCRVFCIRSRQVEVLVSDLTQRGLRSQWPSAALALSPAVYCCGHAFRGLVSGNSCAWTCHIVEKWWRSNTHRQEMEGMSTFTCAYAVNLVAYNRN